MARLSGWLVGATVLAGLLTGCQPAPRPRYLVIVGSRSMVPLLEAVSRRFEEGREDVRITIEAADAERAVNDTRQGLADVGLLPRTLSPLETGLQFRAIARDGVALLVHRSNPVQGLTQAGLSRLLTREYSTWEGVGGAGQAPLLIAQGKGRS